MYKLVKPAAGTARLEETTRDSPSLHSLSPAENTTLHLLFSAPAPARVISDDQMGANGGANVFEE